jgi:hypothetical protein
VGTYLTTDQVQQWLEKTRFAVTEIESARETTARDLVFGRVGSRYDTTGWVDSATTPSLVLSIMSGFYAAWLYNAIASEDMGETDYGASLIRMLNGLLDSIASSALDLDGVDPSTLGTVAFFPTDLQDTDEQGNEIKFTMGVTF